MGEVTYNPGSRFTCDYCSEKISEQDQICAKCGYPIKGNSEEQRKFISLKGRMKHELKSLKTQTESAQIILYVLSGLFFIVGVASYFLIEDKNISFNLLIENLILCAIFLALGGWSKTKPVLCVSLGLAFYILSQIILFNGIIVSVFVIVIFIKGLSSAIDAERIKKEHKIS